MGIETLMEMYPAMEGAPEPSRGGGSEYIGEEVAASIPGEMLSWRDSEPICVFQSAIEEHRSWVAVGIKGGRVTLTFNPPGDKWLDWHQDLRVELTDLYFKAYDDICMLYRDGRMALRQI